MAESTTPKLPLCDRFLTLWSVLARAAGVSAGYFYPGVTGLLDLSSGGIFLKTI